MEYINITLKGNDQKDYQLSDFKGQKIILYFYPKDNTSGCTIEAKDFSHYRKDFEALGYKIIGVSKDSVRSHINFTDKQDLSILLLSDPDQLLIKAFDVLQEKQMYGKTYLGVVRSTFILDEQGHIIESYRNVKAKTHVASLLKTLKA